MACATSSSTRPTVVRKLQPLPDWCPAIPAQVNQVFLNLLVNAAQAIAEHAGPLPSALAGTHEDEIWIEVGRRPASGMDRNQVCQADVRAVLHHQAGWNRYGTGDVDVRTTIVRKHGGRIDVQSTPGVGSRIRVWLPVAGPAEVAADAAR
jgi:two-component system NtrC family sensor kinase